MDPIEQQEEIAGISRLHKEILKKLGEYVVGNRDLVTFILAAMLAEGHVLVEGIPGTAKTTITKSIALVTGCGFTRIQGAIDLQPADMLGVRIYDRESRDFVLRRGPIFANVVLADEINRVNPKSQSAFIEAMAERQVTIDGITLPLPSPFAVIATQNPYEFEGTFPMIKAQRDRFMFSISSSYLSPEDELAVIRRSNKGHLVWDDFSAALELEPLLSPEQLLNAIEVVRRNTIEEPVLRYIRNLVVATRTHPDIDLGASSRASIALVRGGKAMAALRNSSYVIPDDIKEIAPAVLSHRILLTREAEIGGLTTPQIIDEILRKTEVL